MRVETLKIKMRMLEKNISQATMADKLGISQPHLHDLINGRRTNYRRFKQIARILGETVRYFFPDAKPARRRAKLDPGEQGGQP